MDYYLLLGVEKDASNEEIRKAYRKMAIKFHPDRNLENDTTDKFQEIQSAYNYLQTLHNIPNDDLYKSITYSDLVFEKSIISKVIDFKGDIGITVDLDWENNYVNRDQHPKSEADNVLLDKEDNILELRKNISTCKEFEKIGEFTGIVKLSKKASKIFLDKYYELKASHKGKFHNSPSLEKALVSDMLQELINSEIKVEPILITGKWCEIDTPQDLERARRIFT